MEQQKKLITDVYKEVINFDSRKVILNWGQLGSGKTRAAYYFEENLSSILNIDNDSFFHVHIKVPVDGKDANIEIVKNILDNLSLRKVKKEILAIIKDIGEDELFKRINKKVKNKAFIDAVIHLSNDILPLKTFQYYVFDGLSSADLKTIGLSKSLKTNEDYVTFLVTVIVAMTSGQKKRAFILWVDDMEKMIYYSSQQFKIVSQLLTSLIDKIDEKFLVFLNFTLADNSLDIVKLFFSDELWSRINKKIRFKTSSSTVEIISLL